MAIFLWTSFGYQNNYSYPYKQFKKSSEFVFFCIHTKLGVMCVCLFVVVHFQYLLLVCMWVGAENFVCINTLLAPARNSVSVEQILLVLGYMPTFVHLLYYLKLCVVRLLFLYVLLILYQSKYCSLFWLLLGVIRNRNI